MSVLRFLTLILLFTTLLGACGRSDLIRIRLLSPIAETKKNHAIFSDSTSVSTSKVTTTDPESNGASLYFLFKSIGLGYTTITTKMEKADEKLTEKTTLVTNFADVAFGIGENYTFMWGAGVLTGGKWETSLEYESKTFNPKHNYLGGHSLFFVLGHHGFGFETLLGYRTNSIKAEFEEINSSHDDIGKTGKDFTYESNIISLKTSQVQLGIGFTF